MILEKIFPGQGAWAAAIEIYHEAFSAEVRLPDTRLIELVERGSVLCFAGKENAAVVGMALVAVFTEAKFTHLDYFAIKRERQGVGLGSEMLRALRKYIANSLPEMESLSLETVDDAEGRRIAFYQRQGAKRLKNVRYFFPAYGANGPIPMSLLLFPLRSEFMVTQEMVRRMIVTLYTELHRQSPDHPTLVEMVADVPASIEYE